MQRAATHRQKVLRLLCGSCWRGSLSPPGPAGPSSSAAVRVVARIPQKPRVRLLTRFCLMALRQWHHRAARTGPLSTPRGGSLPSPCSWDGSTAELPQRLMARTMALVRNTPFWPLHLLSAQQRNRPALQTTLTHHHDSSTDIFPGANLG